MGPGKRVAPKGDSPFSCFAVSGRLFCLLSRQTHIKLFRSVLGSELH